MKTYGINDQILTGVEMLAKKSKWQTKDGKWWTNDGSGKKPYQPKQESQSINSSDDIHEQAIKKYGKDKIDMLTTELKSNAKDIKNGDADMLNHVLQNTGDLADGVGVPKKVVQQFLKHYLDKAGVKYDKSNIN